MGNGNRTPLVTAVLTLFFLEFLVFVFWFTFSTNISVPFLDWTFFEFNLFDYFVIASASAVFFFSLTIYLVLSTRTHAGKIANKMLEGVLESREMFLELYEHGPVPYFLVSSQGVIHFPNKAAVRLYGGTSTDLEDKKFIDLFLKEDKNHAQVLIGRINARAVVSNEEIQIAAIDGSIRWVLLSILPLRMVTGKGSNGLITLFDITEQKNVDRAKTEFVSLASHQLRTPLSAIKWYTELLISGDVGSITEKQKRYLEKVYKGNERMIDLVNTLLSVSRLEMGTLAVDTQPTNVVEITESVHEELLEAVLKKSLLLEKDYDRELPLIQTDQKLFRMIVQNLLSNAVKYTPERGTIHVSLKKRGSELYIEVSDTGYGIPKNEQDKIFTKMFRAENIRRIESDGTGLGLYIVKSVVEVLGGSISFISEEHKGTAFTVALPMR